MVYRTSSLRLVLPVALVGFLGGSPALAQTDTTGTWENESIDLLDSSNEGSLNPYDFMHRLQMMRDVDGFYERRDRRMDEAATNFFEQQQQMLQNSASGPNLLQVLPSATPEPRGATTVDLYPSSNPAGMSPNAILDRLDADPADVDLTIEPEPILTIEPANASTADSPNPEQ